ncbi:MAG: hypothetical protein ACO3TG_03920, partial [Minisyncoccia bacterium]
VESIFFIGSGVTIGLLQLNIITMREVLQAFLPVIVILIGVWVLSSDKQNRIEKREDKEETKS